ncbi:beta-galactoside-binding lectin-like [Brienomyrus brachyistius]|uniref:beta-galactoside-binding lectin-like n=1 Tax=Brienomyrus brachyistius TaxID=42636 RepID=UPI0020B2EAC6|nr:beta-galactoside-binding lectin-like [Brienomyrus brachyistius]
MNLSLMDMAVKAANKLTITGILTLDAKRFTINVGHGERNIALHFDARFNYQGDRRIIILNYKRDGNFSTEKRIKHFFFQQGKEFQITITFNHDEFHVTIPDDYPVPFPNSFGDDQFKFIQVLGDIRLKSFDIE